MAKKNYSIEILQATTDGVGNGTVTNTKNFNLLSREVTFITEPNRLLNNVLGGLRLEDVEGSDLCQIRKIDFKGAPNVQYNFVAVIWYD